MARPRKERRGEGPVWRSRAKEWVARVWENGECSGWTSLGDNRERAQELFERWLTAGVVPNVAPGKELFGVAAARILAALEARGEDVSDRRSRLAKYGLHSLGHLEVARIEPHHLSAVLDAMRDRHDKSASTINHLRCDVSIILGQLKREGAILFNFAKGLALPKGARVDTRERMTLSDEQILKFQEKRGFGTQLDMMVLFTRGIGGQRPSDNHAGRWEEVDRVDFSWMLVRRPKTDGVVGSRAGKRRTRAYEKVTHEIPEDYRPLLRAYWEAQGKPESGPIFPLLRDGVAAPMTMKDGRQVTRRASKAGGHKGGGSSYAKALRDAVWECELYDPMPGFDPAAPDKALCRFQTDTETTLRLDFKGLRGALVTALADAGVDGATRLAITGHTQETTQLRHYMQKRRVKVPRAALPGGAVEAPTPQLSAEQRAALLLLLGSNTPPVPASPSPKGCDMASHGGVPSGVVGPAGGASPKTPAKSTIRDSIPRPGRKPPHSGAPGSRKSA